MSEEWATLDDLQAFVLEESDGEEDKSETNADDSKSQSEHYLEQLLQHSKESQQFDDDFEGRKIEIINVIRLSWKQGERNNKYTNACFSKI